MTSMAPGNRDAASGGKNRPCLMGLAVAIPGLTALDNRRAASMADEGSVPAATIGAQRSGPVPLTPGVSAV